MDNRKLVYNMIRKLAIILLTIVANQNGELVPDRTNTLKQLVDILNQINDLMEG